VKDWIWEYNTLYPEHSVFTIIEDNDEIIGTQGMLPIYLISQGKRYLSGKSESSLLDPKYRGGSLFRDLYAFAVSLCQEKKMYCVWGFTSAVRVWRHKLKFAVYENVVHDATLVLNLKKMNLLIDKSQGILKRIGHILSNLRGFLYSIIFRNRFNSLLKKKQGTYVLQHHYHSITDLERLYKKIRERLPHLIHIAQDEDYLNWRIYNNPHVKYKTYFLYKGSSLKAYCYLGDYKKEIISITDFAFEKLEDGIYLLKQVLNEIQKENFAYAYFMGNLKNPLILDIFRILRKFGFIKHSNASAFILKSTSGGDPTQIYSIENWYFTALWTEGFVS